MSDVIDKILHTANINRERTGKWPEEVELTVKEYKELSDGYLQYCAPPTSIAEKKMVLGMKIKLIH